MSVSVAFHNVKSISAYASVGMNGGIDLIARPKGGDFNTVTIYFEDAVLAARLIDAINTVVGERATELLEASVKEVA